MNKLLGAISVLLIFVLPGVAVAELYVVGIAYKNKKIAGVIVAPVRGKPPGRMSTESKSVCTWKFKAECKSYLVNAKSKTEAVFKASGGKIKFKSKGTIRRY